jgi:F0F1-type ATP synthase assembly protein I
MDIILLIFLAFKISNLAAKKGEQRNKWVMRLVFLFVMGELIGAGIGYLIFGIENLIPIALIGLGVAGTFYFMIFNYLNNLPDKIEKDINEIQ